MRDYLLPVITCYYLSPGQGADRVQPYYYLSPRQGGCFALPTDAVRGPCEQG